MLQSCRQDRAGIPGRHSETGAPTCIPRAQTLLTHKESIDLLEKLGSKYTPELKGANRAASCRWSGSAASRLRAKR